MSRSGAWLTTIALCVGCLGSAANAQEPPKRPAEAIQDNSFLIEEAYNQEAGVVQHILNITGSVTRQRGPDDRELMFVFTQEWPFFSQDHQLSYTVPFTFLDEGGMTSRGFGDVFLNYRYQALMESAGTPAFAPRLSVILPTGDEDRGLGNGTVGYQVNLPVSKIVSDRWTVHGNAGATVLPDVSGHDLVNFNVGASAIYAVTPTFNFMLEAVGNWDEEVNDAGRTKRRLAAVVSPGFRYAINHKSGAQTVLGLAAPIGVTSAAPDYGFFVYLSFEHPFLPQPTPARGK